MRRLFLSLFLAVCLWKPAHAIVINEISAENRAAIQDADGDFSDWLELHNESDAAVNLADWSLSDDRAKPRKWLLPAVELPAKGFLLIWCSNKNRRTDELHTNFKLASGGERLALFRKDGSLADSLTYPPLRADVSYARFPDGSARFILMTQPTPERANLGPKQTLLAPPPTISHDDGRYDSAIRINISSPLAGAQIFYKLGGATNASYMLVNGDILVTRSTVLWAQVRHPDLSTSLPTTRIFFINETTAFFELPVVTLTVDPKDLWDSSTGIYANPRQRGDEWERPASVAFFEKGAHAFSVDAGVRMHGGASRFKSEKKSFRLYFRSQYGPSKLEYPIIPSATQATFDRLVLRASFNDCWTHWLEKERRAATYHRDQIMRDLFLHLGYPASHGDYAHLFLNGEYWGLYNISERYDNDFFNYYVGEGDYDVVKPGLDELNNAIEAADGDLVAWREFENWFRRTNFATAAAIEEFKRRVDFANFVDFYLLNIWGQNTDWPRHNWYAYRERSAQGRWVFLPWDSEFSFGGGTSAFEENVNVFKIIDDQAGSYPFCSLLSKLRKNDEFARAVVLRFRYLRVALLNSAKFDPFIDRRSDEIRAAMPLEAERWGSLYAPDNYYDETTWEQALSAMRKFALNRSRYVQQHISLSLPNAVAEAQEAVVDYRLAPAFPNPFNSSVRIAFELPAPSAAELTIYNIHGQAVRRLLNEVYQDAGRHALIWSGEDDAGLPTAAGVYVIRIKANGWTAAQKVSYIK